MLIIGLTGGISSGKTSVSDQFAQLGVPIIDQDQLARNIVEPGQAALDEICTHFGQKCLDHAGRLNRAYIREQIFTSTAHRKLLEAILHPRIIALTNEHIIRLNALYPKIQYCLVVIPLLVETRQNYLLDRILLVDLPEVEQIKRLSIRDNVTEEQALRIINSQASRLQRIAVADDIIENIGTKAALRKKVLTLHQYYLMISN